MSEEKREEATPRAERRARERGRVWQSRDLTLAAILFGSGIALRLGSGALTEGLLDAMRAPFASPSRAPADALLDALTMGAWLTCSILAIFVTLAALVSALQVGPLFAPRAIELDTSRLDASSRLGDLFGARAGATLAMTIARLALSAAVVAHTLHESLPGIATLARSTPSAALDAVFLAFSALLVRLGAAMGLLGAVDAVVERLLHRRSLRMSRPEVERDRREQDGDEHVRRERDRVRQEAVSHDVELSVESARLVVDDGDVKVALSYDEADPEAVPQVVAIGRGLLGDRITQIAEAHGVKRVADEELAIALAVVPLGHPIPEHLYASVARTMLAGAS